MHLSMTCFVVFDCFFHVGLYFLPGIIGLRYSREISPSSWKRCVGSSSSTSPYAELPVHDRHYMYASVCGTYLKF